MPDPAVANKLWQGKQVLHDKPESSPPAKGQYREAGRGFKYIVNPVILSNKNPVYPVQTKKTQNKPILKTTKITVSHYPIMPNAYCLLPGEASNKPKRSHFYLSFLCVLCGKIENS
jgi:hypothetical protein